ncbi:hypothetical protein RB195_016554 [Necator americanus]|uniref:Reverse transcriptase domain-containing protein n=1 Tax=Necator americanus TaxID=51031 RepID=A0ABR1C3L7_NECAM
MTSYLQKERIPDQWKTLRTVLIHKKGDREDLRNYRPICLLSVLYKVFIKIILTRIPRMLDEAQPQEQAGFRHSAAWTTSRPCRGKGVRQGDTISPMLFMAALQWIMKSLSWEERGIRVDGRFLSNLRFADDIVLFSSSTNEAETMLNELNEAGKRIGLRINRKKTQFMKNA